MNKIEIGTRVSYQDMANPYQEGTIVDIKEINNIYTITGTGLKPANQEVTVIYEDLHTSSFPAGFFDGLGGHNIVDKPKATPEEVEELKQRVADKLSATMAEGKARDQERERKIKEGRAFIESKRPAWAKAVIVGIEEIDQSDIITDYFATKDGRTILLAWSTHTKDLFSEMRKAAVNAPETEHLATPPNIDSNGHKRTEDNKKWWTPADEHREKYSMGAGYYLKAGHRYSTGWKVEKWPLSDWYMNRIALAEYQIPENQAPKESEPKEQSNGAVIGSYKGNPTISLPLNGDRSFTFGLSKAKAILNHLEDIKRFVEGR